MKQQIVSQLEYMIDPTEEKLRKTIEAEKEVAQLIKPLDFAGGKIELKYDKDFEKNCIALSRYSLEPIERVSVRRYYTLLEVLRDGRTADKI